jgi:hypothetical protein
LPSANLSIGIGGRARTPKLNQGTNTSLIAETESPGVGPPEMT